MTKLRKKISCFLLSLALVICNFGGVHLAQAAENIIQVSVSGEEFYDEAYEILKIVNKERVANGKKPLTMNKKLMEGAMRRSNELSLYYSHTRPNEESCFSIPEFKEINHYYAGENIAPGDKSAQEVMNVWMDSPGHRANILNENFNSIGIGVYKNNGRLYFTQLFADANSTTTTQPANRKVTSYIDISNNMLNISLEDKDLYEDDNPYMKRNEERQLYVVNKNIGWLPSITYLNNYNIKWTSSNENVAKVSQSGIVKTFSEGTVTITAIVGNMKEVSYKITVDDDYDYDENLYEGGKIYLSLDKKTSNSISLSWTKVLNASGYELLRSTSLNGTYESIARVEDNSPWWISRDFTYTDKNLTTGNTYYYKVRGYKYVNGRPIYGNYSDVISAKTALSKPVATAKKSSYKSIDLTWKSVNDASGYEIYRSTSESGKYIKEKTIEKSSTLSYKDTKATTGKTYYYKIRAYKNVNGKKVYSSYSKVVSAKASLTTPTVTLTSGSKKATVKWKKVSGANGYEIYRATTKNGKYTNIKTIKNNSTTSYTNSKLASKKGYYYKVRAYINVNGKKVYSSYSSIKYIKTK